VSAIVACDDAPLAAALSAGLGAAFDDVTVVDSIEAIPDSALAEVIAVHAATDAAGAVRRSVKKLPGVSVLVVVPTNSEAEAIAAMRSAYGVAGVLTTDRVSESSVSAVAKRLSGGAVFGLENLVGDDTEVFTERVTSYGDKLTCIGELERFAKSNGVRRKYLDPIIQCADEMLMNALYVAPLEAQSGGASSPSSLADRLARGVIVQYAAHDGTIYLAVRDSYGSLRRDALLNSWAKAVETAKSGAGTPDFGLGLYIISNSSSTVRFNIAPGIATECICSFDTRAKKVHLTELGVFGESDRSRVKKLKEQRDAWARDARSRQAAVAAQVSDGSRAPILIAVLAAVAVGLLVLVLLSRS
jgi:hypothetical protein